MRRLMLAVLALALAFALRESVLDALVPTADALHTITLRSLR